MANLKNITELPVAESAEGLNLIVNDGGSAKQIAASAVGAQADFSVTDENSPAFIKNKPSVAQADWNENDKLKASFIKNKPFYDTREFDTIEVTFDGNIENKEKVDLEDNFYLIKVSDKTPTKEEIIGSTISVNNSGEIFSLELHENVLQEMDNLLIGSDNMFFIVYTDCIFMDLSLTKGLWFGAMGPESYITSLSWYGAVSGELKQIDPNYIKDMYYTEKFENIEVLTEITKTPDENNLFYIEESIVPLVENGFYTVTWNGTEYHCQCFIDENLLILSSEMFAIIYHPNMIDEGFNAIVEVYDGSESVIMSIIGTYNKIHKINPKYIPSEGLYTQAIGQYAHAEGASTSAEGDYSHAEGAETTASGENSHAEGYNTTASGENSHAEGYNTTASGHASHAEGTSETKATGIASHAEGGHTTASGHSSHAEGSGSKASGENSHAEGNNTQATSKSQHAQGEYNIIDTEGTVNTRGKYAHIVGNGTSNNARSNAHTLDWLGNAWYAGTVECTGIILTSHNGTKYQISVADDGTLTSIAI